MNFSIISQTRPALSLVSEVAQQEAPVLSLYSLPIEEQSMFKLIMLLPVGALLYAFLSPNTGFLFVLTAVLYFLNYEMLHFAYHTAPGSWLGRLSLIRSLRQHHVAHHNKQLMTKYNFNITYPICDYLFGTLYRREKDA